MERESEQVAERGSSGLEVCAEAEESDGSPNWPMVCATFSRISSLGDPFCKGYCGQAGRGTSRGSEDVYIIM